MRALVCLALAACSFERPADVTFGSSAITITGGDNQEGIAGLPLALPLEVNVVDDDLRPIVNFTVEFSVTDGEGTLSDASVRTDAQGNATTVLTLGKKVGDNTVDVTGEGISSDRIFFSATGLVGAPGRLVAVSGTDESSIVDTELAVPLVARLEDANENPISNMPVDFVVTAGGGSVSVAQAMTNVDGLVETRATPGTTAGANSIEARFPGLEPAVFALTGLADVAATITKLEGDGVVNAFVPSAPIVVVVRDQYGNPVEGTNVAWTTNGTGVLSAASSISGADGRAETVLTATSMTGSNTVAATVNGLTGSPVQFVAPTRTLRNPVSFSLAASNFQTVATASAVADIDGDNKPDLVVARGTGSFSLDRFEVLLNRTDANSTSPSFLLPVVFTACANGDSVTSLSVVDVDGDGKRDVVLTAGENLVIHLNTTPTGGAPTFAPRLTFENTTGSSHYRNHVMVDFDGDTKLDAIVDVDQTPSRTVLKRSTAVTTPTFANDVMLNGALGPFAAADLDGDDKVDLLAGTSSVQICRNTNGSCTNLNVSFSGTQGFAVIDVDGDDKPDLVAPGSGQNQKLSVAMNTTAASLAFATATNISIDQQVSAIRGADINGDGKVDVIGTSGSNVVVVFNTTTNNTPAFAGASVFSAGVSVLHAADLNGDQRLDLVGFSSGAFAVVRLQE